MWLLVSLIVTITGWGVLLKYSGHGDYDLGGKQKVSADCQGFK